MEELVELTFFQTKYGMPLGPGADEGEDFACAWETSSVVSWVAVGVLGEAASRGEGFPGGEEVVEESFVDVWRDGCPRKGGEARCLAGGD